MPWLIKSQRQHEKGKWVFLVRGGFQLAATQRYFSSPAAGCGLPSCWQRTGMEQPDAARLHWSPSQFTHATPKLLCDATQVVSEAHEQAVGMRLMEVSFLPALLPAHGPPFPFAESQFLFTVKRDNENAPKPWRHWGGGLGTALLSAVCASPRDSCWCSKAGPCCSSPVASSLSARTPCLPV